jgi:hypothetical protein
MIFKPSLRLSTLIFGLLAACRRSTANERSHSVSETRNDNMMQTTLGEETRGHHLQIDVRPESSRHPSTCAVVARLFR